MNLNDWTAPVMILAMALAVVGVLLLLVIALLLRLKQQSTAALEPLTASVAQWHDNMTQQQTQQQQHNNQLTALLSQQFAELKSDHQHQLTQQKHYIFKLFSEQKHSIESKLGEHLLTTERSGNDVKATLSALLNEQKEQLSQNQIAALGQLNGHLSQLTEHLATATKHSRDELNQSLQKNAETIGLRMSELTQSTDERLKEISAQVEKRLSDGFEKTTQTFNDILKRLALIDRAQQTITELSSDVVSLQEVLADKRSRGAFGEVQLSSLIRNVLPENQFAFQHTLSNGKIADCVLFLPQPTGNVVIDAKFPLESYRKMTDNELAAADRKAAERQFKLDVRKHISDIADKYLIKNETSDGALMFIPAEAIFAEIHAHHPDVLENAYQRRVWLASPTTLMAILTTARSVLKDEATRQQVHIIQQHLVRLGSDFGRFRTRFDNLAKHIEQAAGDVQLIHTSATKISNRFSQIEQVDIPQDTDTEAALTP